MINTIIFSDEMNKKWIINELFFLTKNNSKSIHTKQEDLLKRFNKFKKYYHTLNDVKIRNFIHKRISKEPRPTDIKPMTIGAFLFGASLNNYGALNKKESVLCYESINGNIKHLSSQIWVKIDGKYKKINNNKSEIVHIYVDDDFEYFTSEEIDLLTYNGIKRGNIYKTHYSKHYVYNYFDKKYTIENPEIMNLNLFPVIKNKIEPIINKIKYDKYDSNKYKIVLLVVIFLVLAILVYSLVHNNYKYEPTYH